MSQKPTDRHRHAEQLRRQLARLRDVPSPSEDPELKLVAEWQSRRLQHTHRDLAADRRYRPAARFFLTDLYGPHDLTRRDDDMQRASPFLGRTLPDNVLHSLGLALEQLALSRKVSMFMIEMVLTCTAYLLKIKFKKF